MMPQAGTRVSLYFKGAEESSAIAVNCIRSGDGCTGANYRNKTLTTEHGMQLRLCECDMGVVTLSNEVKLDNLRGIHLKAGGKLNITASGDVSLEAPQVTIHGEKGVEAYEGPVIEIDEGVFDVDVRAKVVLSSGEGGVRDVDYRGAEKTYFPAWESENLSDVSFRYRDAPEDGHYDWGGLIGNVTGGIAVGVGVGLCAYIGVGALAASSVKVASLMGTAGVTAGSVGVSTAAMATGYTMSLAISDVMSGRVSSTEDYIRKALAGSVIGFLAGASPLARAGMGAGGSMAVGALEGAAGSAASQWIINGAIKLDQVIMDGAFSGLVELGMWNWRNAVKEAGNSLELSTRFLNKNDPLWKNADNIKPIDGYQDIVCHGDKFSLVFKNADGIEVNVSVQEFSEILKNSPVYEGKPIRLISCETGADGAISAQYLANYLGVEVIAPTDIVYVYPDGAMKIGKNDTGYWKTFKPKEQ